MAEVSKPTPEQLAAILADHAKWLRGESGGKKANLRSADLSGANLRNADLYGANLYGANLRSADIYGANLRSADLTSADLRSADLSGANLRNADLTSANLRNADLSGADLSGADLRSADLRSANLSGAVNADLVWACTEIVPREGEVIGWKKLAGGVLAKLRIPPEARRSNATGRKCRAEFAEVLEIIDPRNYGRFHSMHDESFTYTVGTTARPSNGWGEDRFTECAPGIHFYLTREEAEAHT